MKSFRLGAVTPALLACSLITACFEDRSSGGTDEVDNPALTTTLRTAGGQGMAGTLRVFARHQNPAKDSVAVLTVTAGEKGVEIRAKSLLAAMEAAALAGVPWKDRDSLLFNLVGSTDAQEAFRADYLLLRIASDTLVFQRLLPPEGGLHLKGNLDVSLPMSPVVAPYQGSVGADGSALGLKVIFIPGSPYKAAVAADGSFTLARIAAGRYDVRALDGDGKVFQPADSLATDAAFAPADWSEADIIWIGD